MQLTIGRTQYLYFILHRAGIANDDVIFLIMTLHVEYVKVHRTLYNNYITCFNFDWELYNYPIFNFKESVVKHMVIETIK